MFYFSDSMHNDTVDNCHSKNNLLTNCWYTNK